MRKALKLLGWTSLAGLLCLAAAAVAAKLYFTPARLKALTLEYAGKNLGREVTFDGVKLDLSGLAISNLRVSEYPDFKRGEFLSAGTFSVRPSLRALLRREVRIHSITASGLKLRVREVKKDTYNFSDLIAAKPAQKPARPADKRPAPPPLAVSSLKVRDSRFSYSNAAGDMRVELRDIALSASGISPDGLFPLEGAFTLDVVSPYFKGSIPARLKGRVALGNFDMQKGRAEIDKASLALGGVKAEVKGSLDNLLEPDAKLSLAVAQFSTSDLRGVFKSLPHKVLLPEIDADADFKLTMKDLTLRSVSFRAGAVSGALKGRAAWEPKVSYDLQADLKAQLPEADTTLLARRFKQLPVPRGFKFPMTALQAKLKLKDGLADITSFSADSDALALAGRTTVNFGGQHLKAAGSVKASLKSLAKAAAMAPALLAPYEPAGKAAAQVEFSYGGALALKGRADLDGVGAVVAGRTLAGLTGSVDFTGDSASARKLEGKLDGEALSASFSVRDLARHPKAEFDLKLDKLILKDSPPAAQQPAAGGKKAAGSKPAGTPPLDISGRAELGGVEHPNFRCGAITARLDLVNVTEDLKALDGSASFSAGPGKFSELYALAGRYKAAKVALYPLLVLQKTSKLAKTLNLPDFNNIQFDRIEGDYSFAKGLMRLNKSAMTAAVADVSSSGTIDLPAEKLDMRVSTALKRGSGISMSAPLAMTVKGPFANPSVKPDVKSIAEQPAVKKVLDKALPEGSKLLKNLFKK
ncbi:MAG: AsmA family protein [Elusimicrobiales bacterium]|nr:AsmA family protein [Elusimicrobiales bacterium]